MKIEKIDINGKKEPIEVLIVSPTKIVTQDSDISKLKTK